MNFGHKAAIILALGQISQYVFADMHGAPPAMSQYGSGYDANDGYGQALPEQDPMDRDHRSAHDMSYDYGPSDATVLYKGHWSGTMTGSWNNGPIRTWNGTYDNDGAHPHWSGRYSRGDLGYAPGYLAPYGYDSHAGYHHHYAESGYEEVLVPSEPIITRTVTTHVSYVDVPYRAHYVYQRVAYHPVHHYAPKCRVAPHPIMGS